MNLLKSLLGGSGALSAQQASERIAGEQPPFILDVRQPDEFKVGHIAGAKLIPLDQLNRRLNELPKDQEILCVCRSGARSGVAVGQLKSAGFNAINLRGGMMGWQSAGCPVKKGK